ncbi:MAG: helix-turn-helix domain-containing protein [Alphaproteobacteria bacterium]
MGRRKSFEPTDVLDRAMRAFWRRGYGATSVDDLVTATGVNRASLYATFGGKAELFHACLKRYAREVAGPSLAAMPRADQEAPKRFLKAVAAYAASDPMRQGCLMVNTAAETAAHDAETLAVVRGHVANLEDAFAEALGSGTDASRRRARLALCLSVGLLVLGKVGVERAALEEAVEAAFD